MVNFNRDYTMTINGEPRPAPATFDVFNPATRAVIAKVPDASKEQLDEAVSAARNAFPAWSATPLPQRQKLLVAIAESIEQNAEELIRLLTREQGKPRAGAEWEVGGSAIWFRELAKQSLEDEVIEDTRF